MTAAGVCAHCGKPVEVDRVGFREECPHCGGGVHACVMCAHYAPGKHYDCAEPQVELVVDKLKNNRCEWYRFRGGGGGPARLSRDDAAALLKDLLKR